VLEVLAKGGEPMAEELSERAKEDWVLLAASELDDETSAILTSYVVRRAALSMLEAVGFFERQQIVQAVAAAYPNDPGTSDLDDAQPVSISLGVVRQAWAALAKVDR
jgi:hypothetical protein